MRRGQPYHRWDNDAPDTRVRQSHEPTVPGWSHSMQSTFAEPSRLGDPVRPPPPRSRRSVLRLVAGVGTAAVTGAALALLLRGRTPRG